MTVHAQQVLPVDKLLVDFYYDEVKTGSDQKAVSAKNSFARACRDLYVFGRMRVNSNSNKVQLQLCCMFTEFGLLIE